MHLLHFITRVRAQFSTQHARAQIRLEASSIVMPNLRTALPPSSSSFASSSASSASSSGGGGGSAAQHKVYQLCACSNGKLFLAMSHSVCAGDEASVCR